VAIASWLDRVLYRHPFEGASARRYADAERPAFGDFDDRMLDALAPRLDGTPQIATPDDATRRTGAPHTTVSLLDVGAGPGTFAMRAAARFPKLRVVAVEPSRDFARPRAGVDVACARGEALPLADASIDVAICLSSIRHVRDRRATLRELRRVVRRSGRLVIVELDPAASSRRIAAHADRLASPLLRHAFGPFVVRTAPPVAVIEALARGAGWSTASCRDDTVQPVYILELA
jgi:ubiquinone/menaquinone biosynthesis C-methylase UbiE